MAKMLWIPPSLPYYALGGAYSELGDAARTKRLVFSSWRMVPRALSVAVSESFVSAVAEMYRGRHGNRPKDASGLLKFAETGGGAFALRYQILFYGCSNNVNCQSTQFNTAWSVSSKPTLEQINSWNRTRRFGKAYLDSDGDPALDLSVNLKRGIATENLEENFNWWAVAIKDLKKTLAE